jgi:hypothetical protein
LINQGIRPNRGLTDHPDTTHCRRQLPTLKEEEMGNMVPLEAEDTVWELKS